MAHAQLDTVLRRLRGWRDTHALSEASDTQLLERFTAGGEEAAFTMLLRRHGPMVLGVSRRILHSLQDAEDVFQATFLLLARKAGSIRKRSAVGCWLHGVAHRLAVRAKEQRTCRQYHERRAADMRETATMTPAWPDVQTTLDTALDELPEKYRAALVLCYLEGKSHAEAAAQLACPLATLRSHVARGRNLLRVRLMKRGLALSATGLISLLLANTATALSPTALTKATAKAALALAAGSQTTAVCSIAVAELVEGGLRSMFLGKMKIATALLLAAAFVAAACGLAPSLAASAKPQAVEAKPQAAETKPEAADDAIIFHGRVVGPDGKAVAGASIAVIDDEKGAVVPQLKSNAEGKFALRLSRPQTVTNPRHIVVSAPGFGVAWESERQSDAVFHLVPDLPINGRVIDLQGKPVAGATVAVHDVHAGPPGAFDGMLKNWKKTAQEQEDAARKLDRYIWNRGGLGQVFHTTTDQKGKFQLTGFGKDRVVSLRITGSGIANTFAAVAIREGFDPAGAPESPLRLYAPRFDVVVYPEKPVIGVVRDEQTKAPLAGIRVSGTSLLGPLPQGMYLFHAWPTPATVTDKEGRFTLHGLAKAKSYILVADPDEGTEHLHDFVSLTDTDGFAPLSAEINLPRGVVLTGRVTDAVTGAGAPARVFYRPLLNNDQLGKFGGYSPPDLPAPWHRGRDTKTNLNGRYKITVMPGAGVVCVQTYGSFERAKAAQKDIDDGIIDKQFGHFRTVGQGGMYNPEYMNAYKVIRPAATDRAATLDVKVQPTKPKPTEPTAIPSSK